MERREWGGDDKEVEEMMGKENKNIQINVKANNWWRMVEQFATWGER